MGVIDSACGGQRQALERRVSRAGALEILWMGNALLFEAEAPVIEALAALPGIDRIQHIVDHGPAATRLLWRTDQVRPASGGLASPGSPPHRFHRG